MNYPTKPDMRALNAPAQLQASISSLCGATPAQSSLPEEMFPAGTILLLRRADPSPSNLGRSNMEWPKLEGIALSPKEAADQCSVAPAPRLQQPPGAACAAPEQAAPSGCSCAERPEVALAWERAIIRLSNACERLTRSIEILMGASGIALIPAERRFVDDGIFFNEAGNCDIDRRACGSIGACSVSRGGGSSNDALPSR